MNAAMHTMKSLFLTLAVVFISVGIAGCKRAPTPRPVAAKLPIAVSDSFKKVAESNHYAEGTRAGDEWTRFRGGFELLSTYFANPEVQERLRKHSAEQRKFLQNDVHLTAEELTEVESASFRTADAHYLDECYLLHDAVRQLEVKDLGTIEQADLHFRWVMRNVLLHEQTDSWVPPAFTLRRGFGSPLERALVFLALLRQSQIDGCLLVTPEAEPKHLLVAVLDPKTSRLHLFDTRLGLPLLSKDRQGVLSLQDALDDPKLLQPSMISKDQAKTWEVWLVCPLYALAPRLLELQLGLNKHDSITLYLDGADLAQEVGKATKLPIKVWNSPAKDKALPNSPTRMLRFFLPKQEGGMDETNRGGIMNQARMPLQSVLFNYSQIKVTERLFPTSGFQFLLGVSADLFNKYDLQTRETFLRGQYDSMIRRHERLRAFTQEEVQADNKKFREELLSWQKNINSASAAELHDDPRIQARGQLAMQAIWAQDSFLRWMIDVSNEEKLDRHHKKTMLTRVLAVGMRDYFDHELARSQASTNYEKAAQEQAVLQSRENPSDAARKRAREAWVIAKSSWSSFYLDRLGLNNAAIEQRLNQLQTRVEPDDWNRRVSMLETLHLDVQKYFQAKLRLAECLQQVEGMKLPKTYLESVKGEIEALEKKGHVQAEIARIHTRLPQEARPFFERRLELLARDWSERGSYFWMKRQIDHRLAER